MCTRAYLTCQNRLRRVFFWWKQKWPVNWTQVGGKINACKCAEYWKRLASSYSFFQFRQLALVSTVPILPLLISNLKANNNPAIASISNESKMKSAWFIFASILSAALASPIELSKRDLGSCTGYCIVDNCVGGNAQQVAACSGRCLGACAVSINPI